MSFLTEYFDNYREHEIKKTAICRPEDRSLRIDGKWLVTDADRQEGFDTIKTFRKPIGNAEWTEEQVKEFIRSTLANMRGMSTYYDDYCSKHPPDIKTRPFIPKKKSPCPPKFRQGQKNDAVGAEPLKPLPKGPPMETEQMRLARALYERDPDRLVLQPLLGHFRVYGYGRPRWFATDISEYAADISRLGYEIMHQKYESDYEAYYGKS